MVERQAQPSANCPFCKFETEADFGTIMQSLTVSLLYFLAFALCMMILKQGLSQSNNILSARNLFLFGLIVYQLVNPAHALYTWDFTLFQVENPAQTGKTFLLFVYLFTGVFLLSYHKLQPSRWLARRFPAPQREIGDSFFLGLAVSLGLLGLVLRFFGIYIPGLGAASTNVSIALAAVSCGIAGWVWGNRPLNLFVIGMTVLIVGIGFVICMTGMFGRRPLIGILLGLAWGAYYRRARYMKPVKLLVMLSPVLVFVVIAVGAYTAIRSHKVGSSETAQTTARKMGQANLSSGIKDIFGGQTTGSAALWAIEQWPDRLEYRPLFSLKFMAYWYVPRYLWPEKPVPLSKEVATLARLDYLNRERITIPPGVIGYAAAEGGLLAVIIYALFFGQFFRFIDELIRLHPMNPFVILPTGCATGNMLGMARGDLAIFTNLIVLGFVFSFALLFVASKMFGRNVQQPYWNPYTHSS